MQMILRASRPHFIVLRSCVSPVLLPLSSQAASDVAILLERLLPQYQQLREQQGGAARQAAHAEQLQEQVRKWDKSYTARRGSSALNVRGREL